MRRDKFGKIIGNSFVEDIMKVVMNHDKLSEIEKEVLIQRLDKMTTIEEVNEAKKIIDQFLKPDLWLDEAKNLIYNNSNDKESLRKSLSNMVNLWENK